MAWFIAGTEKKGNNNVEWFRSNCLSIQSMQKTWRKIDEITNFQPFHDGAFYVGDMLWLLNTNQQLSERRWRWKNWVNCNKQNFIPFSENIIQLNLLFFVKLKPRNDDDDRKNREKSFRFHLLPLANWRQIKISYSREFMNKFSKWINLYRRVNKNWEKLSLK